MSEHQTAVRPARAAQAPMLRYAAAIVVAAATGGCGSASVAVGVAGIGAAGALFSGDSTAVPDEGPYFWHGTDAGTDAYAGPLDVIANKGYATAQWAHTSRQIFDYPYGWSRTVRSLIHPNEAVQNSGGWWSVIQNEVLPFSQAGWNSWAWVPNYYGHLIEGGIASRRLAEWYEAHGVPHASLVAGVTTWGAAFLNEAYENTDPGITHAGVTIDLLVFDIGGILLFNSDGVSRFFAQKLGASIWPTQASLLIPQGKLWNNSHHLVLKVPVGFTDRASLFLKSGIGFQAGVTLHRANHLDISLGFGQESNKRFIDPVTRLETAEFGWAGGLWIDRGGSLLASLLIDPNTDRAVALNVYPGVIPGLGSVGVWTAVDGRGRPSIGITTARTLGIGVGVGF